jgi:hypothetical protein
METDCVWGSLAFGSSDFNSHFVFKLQWLFTFVQSSFERCYLISKLRIGNNKVALLYVHKDFIGSQFDHSLQCVLESM